MNNLKDLEYILQIMDQDLFQKYSFLVNELENKVYNEINEILAIENGIYTNHDKRHFDLVIEQAGYLLQAEKILKLVNNQSDKNKFDCDELKTFFFLNNFELFILLCSIRVHDIALIINRKDHSTNITYTMSILNIEIKSAVKKIIAKISGAHTGKSINHDKDKISDLAKMEMSGSQHYRPQVLAAIVRFADELEEGEHRTCATKIKANKIDPKNIIFHKYSLSLIDLSIDHEESCIKVEFEVPITEIEIYEKPNGEKVTLLQEIYNRLQKLEVERKYFQRFLCNFFSIETVKAKISFVDEHSNIVEEVLCKTGDNFPKIEEFGLEELKLKMEEKSE